MNIRNMEDELQRLKGRKFELEMKDRWSHEDFRLADQLNIQIREIEGKIKNGGDVQNEHKDQ